MGDEHEIAPLHPAVIDEPAQERLEFALGRWRGAQEADASHPDGLLRAASGHVTLLICSSIDLP